TRLRFSQLGAELIPRSESVSSAEQMDASNGIDTAFIERVVERWRGATMGTKRKASEGIGDANVAASPLEAERAMLQEAASSMRRDSQPGLPKNPAAGLLSRVQRK